MSKTQIDEFPEEVFKELKHYVYRLIDPRNGETFYVGKGVKNRVFEHVRGTIKKIEKDDEHEDAFSLKESRIKEIRKIGLHPIHIIHRHGLTDKVALEVESALIDAYPGLSNINNGYNSDKGSMTAYEITNKYRAEIADFKNYRVLLININRSISSDRSIYDSTRFAWRIDKSRAQKADLIIAVEKGIIIDVFVNAVWKRATKKNFPLFSDHTDKRFAFDGEQAKQNILDLYIQKRIPSEFRKQGASNPIKYNFS